MDGISIFFGPLTDAFKAIAGNQLFGWALIFSIVVNFCLFALYRKESRCRLQDLMKMLTVMQDTAVTLREHIGLIRAAGEAQEARMNMAREALFHTSELRGLMVDLAKEVRSLLSHASEILRRK